MLFGKKVNDLEQQLAHAGALLATFSLSLDSSAQDAAARMEAIRTDAAAAAASPLEARIATLEAEGAAAAERLAGTLALQEEKESKLVALTAEAAVMRAAIDPAGALPAGATPEQVREALEARFSTKAAQIVAGAGHEALPIARSEEAGEDEAAIKDQLRAARDPGVAGRLAQKLIDLQQRKAAASN